MTVKKHSLRNEKLKANRVTETKDRKERLRIRRENEKIENHEKQRLATLKRLKRGKVEENPKTGVVASKQLRLTVETGEERK